MIDFTGVTAIAIPEGNVKKISRGTDLLWEKPSSGGNEPIIVFPLTTMSVMSWTPYTLFNSTVTFSRAASVGEKYVIYINGKGHEGTVTEASEDKYILNTNDGYVEFAESGNSDSRGTKWVGRLNAVLQSVTCEVHYIPG